jgi:hypothetical protein
VSTFTPQNKQAEYKNIKILLDTMANYRGCDALATEFLIHQIDKISLNLKRIENDLDGMEKSTNFVFDPTDIPYNRRLVEKQQYIAHLCELRSELAKKIGSNGSEMEGSYALPTGIKRMCEAESQHLPPLSMNFTSLPTTNREGTCLFIFKLMMVLQKKNTKIFFP